MIFQNNDFVFWAKRIFYATSHKKNANDGAGGTVKWLVGSANLMSPFSKQILAPEQLFDFTKSEI